MNSCDVLIKNGRVIDPANNVDGHFDVAISGGRIAAVAADIKDDAAEVFDADGLIVTPGLVDLHVHVYDKVIPLAIDPDHYCLGRGTTTVVDAGSAGADNFAGFRAFAIDRCRTRILGFLNISRMGLACSGLGGDSNVPGELDLIKFASTGDCVNCIEVNRDVLVGVKIRLSDSIADDGRNEQAAFELAVEAARATKLPLMTHHSFSTVSLEDCPGNMVAGDVYTHCFHGFPSTILNPDTTEIEVPVQRARDNGVLFDIGMGQGSFNWTVAEFATRAGFWPDTIGTDLHAGNCEGPTYDMPTTMSRILHLGMPLPEVIRCSTVEPARAVGWDDRIGTLGQGRDADVSVFAIETVDMDLEDCQSQMRRISQLLVPKAVWRAGKPAAITEPRAFPNAETIKAQKIWWPRLLIRDESL
ncbi:MAG: amidohydrolase/deacetylase family metallohydrolase [Lentisphaeria bacterium]